MTQRLKRCDPKGVLTNNREEYRSLDLKTWQIHQQVWKADAEENETKDEFERKNGSLDLKTCENNVTISTGTSEQLTSKKTEGVEPENNRHVKCPHLKIQPNCLILERI